MVLFEESPFLMVGRGVLFRILELYNGGWCLETCLIPCHLQAESVSGEADFDFLSFSLSSVTTLQSYTAVQMSQPQGTFCLARHPG